MNNEPEIEELAFSLYKNHNDDIPTKKNWDNEPDFLKNNFISDARFIINEGYRKQPVVLLPLDTMKVYEETRFILRKFFDDETSMCKAGLIAEHLCEKLGQQNGLLPLDEKQLIELSRDYLPYGCYEFIKVICAKFGQQGGLLSLDKEACVEFYVKDQGPYEWTTQETQNNVWANKFFDRFCAKFGTSAVNLPTAIEIFIELMNKRELNCKKITEKECRELSYYSIAIHQMMVNKSKG